MMVGAGMSEICRTYWETGNSGKSCFCCLESKLCKQQAGHSGRVSML